MNILPFSFLELALILIPILVSMIVFKRSVYDTLNSTMLPGIFIVRIISGTAFFIFGKLIDPAGSVLLHFRSGDASNVIWIFIFAFSIVAILVSSVDSRTKSNQDTYPQLRTDKWTPPLILGNAITWATYLFGYEFFFRGVLLFYPIGDVSLAMILTINAVLYAFAHCLKGWKEFLLSAPFGILLCYLCLATNSFYPAFFIHAALALSNDWFGILYQRSKRNHRDVKSFVLVTGASAGIGKALSLEFASRGKNLLLVSLPGTGLENLAAEIEKNFNVSVHFYCTDLTQPQAYEALTQWCKINSYHVDTLVNNAGFGNLNPFEKTNSSVVHNMMSLNNAALVKLTHEFIPELKKFRQSYIMNVGSLASFMPIPNKSLYAATKSFVYSFSQSLFYELRPANIHVSCLCPGGTLTERVKNEMNDKNLKRSGFCLSPEDVAKSAVSGMYNKEFRIIPGWYNQILYWLSQILPDAIKIRIIDMAFNTRENTKVNPRNVVSPVKSIALLTR